MYEIWEARITAESEYDAVNAIVEEMANDDSITNDEYSALCEMAIAKFRIGA